MRKLETHSELPSKFDLPSVYFGKYYQTFGIDEIVRLMQPYLQEKTKSSLFNKNALGVIKLASDVLFVVVKSDTGVDELIVNLAPIFVTNLNL